MYTYNLDLSDSRDLYDNCDLEKPFYFMVNFIAFIDMIVKLTVNVLKYPL